MKPSTDLTLLAVNPCVGRAAFHLACAPTGGDLGNGDEALSVTHHRDGSFTASCHVGDA